MKPRSQEAVALLERSEVFFVVICVHIVNVYVF